MLDFWLPDLSVDLQCKLAEDLSKLPQLEDLSLKSSVLWSLCGTWTLSAATRVSFHGTRLVGQLYAPKLRFLETPVNTNGLMRLIIGCPAIEQFLHLNDGTCDVDAGLVAQTICALKAGSWKAIKELVWNGDALPTALLVALTNTWTMLIKLDCYIPSDAPASLVKIILAQAPQLQYLRLWGTPEKDVLPHNSTEIKIPAAIRHTSVKLLDLRQVSLDLINLELPQLQILDMRRCTVNVSTILTGATAALINLQLHEVKTPGSLFPADLQLQVVKTVGLSDQPLSDSDLSAISRMQSLQSAFLNCTLQDPLSAAAKSSVKTLSRLPQLITLTIGPRNELLKSES